MHIYIYMYKTSISGHTVNDLTWCNVKCAFSRRVFHFIPQFGLHLCKRGQEEVVMNYQAKLNYHQTSFTSKVSKWEKQYLAVMTIAITLSINLGMLRIPLVWFNKSLIGSSLKWGFQVYFTSHICWDEATTGTVCSLTFWKWSSSSSKSSAQFWSKQIPSFSLGKPDLCLAHLLVRIFLSNNGSWQS